MFRSVPFLSIQLMRIFIVFLSSLVLLSCSSRVEEIADNGNSEERSVEGPLAELSKMQTNSIGLYCWCFSDSSQFFCNTFVAVNPLSLVKKENEVGVLYDESSESFVHYLLEHGDSIQEIPGCDARVVLGLSTKENGIQTFMLFNDTSLVYNNKFLIRYKDNIREIIKSRFGVDYIHCPN